MSKIHARPTQVIVDGQLSDWSPEQIFDAAQFDDFIGVTYSISPHFMNQYLANFTQVELVVGIQNERVQASTNDEIIRSTFKGTIQKSLLNESIKLYEALSPTTQHQVTDRKIEMKVPMVGTTVHSKFYLMKNSTSGATRVVLGSANLSHPAFSNDIRQFEEVLVFHDRKWYDIYHRRFDALKPYLDSYFPDRLFKTINKMKKGVPDQIVSVAVLDKAEIEQIQQNDIVNRVENVKNRIALGLLPENTAQLIGEIPDEEITEQQAERESKRTVRTIYRISKEVLTTRNKRPVIASTPIVAKRIIKHLTVKEAIPVDAAVPARPLLIRKDSTIDIPRNRSGLFTPSELNKQILVPFGKPATVEEVAQALGNINHLLRNYEKYTVKYDAEYGARICEAILFAFTAPFISVVRQRSKGEKEDTPQFLFLGGAANSGKSSLLRLISRMVSLFPGDESYLDYSVILPPNVHQKQSKTITQMSNWFYETSVFPLLIDELPAEFFHDPKRGEELVVGITNNIDARRDTYPALIGTTNSEAYSFGERARRRSYYLKHDKPFDDHYKLASIEAYQSVLNQTHNILFKDFVLRFAEKINDDETEWTSFASSGKGDFLAVTRDIFRQYYQLIDQPLPIFFPTKRYDDDRESNQEKWRKLYLGSSRDDFKYSESTRTVLFKITSLDENIDRFSKNRPSRVYRDAVPAKVLVGAADGIDIELDAETFFEWIQLPNPYQKRGIAARLFRRNKG